MNRHSGAISPKLTLSLLGLMFLIPLTVAWLMYSGIIEFRPGGGVNKGELIDPPIAAELPESFSEQDLAEHWVLAHFPPAPCDVDCENSLHGLGQVLRALGRDAVRVRILLLTEPGSDVAADKEGPGTGFSIIRADTGKLSQQFESLGNRNDIFIIDPLGNIMMRYVPETSAEDILSDMERLLQYQKTDRQ